METKKTLFICVAMLFISVDVFSQHTNKVKDEEKIKAEKVAFLTTQLDLTVAEAQKFWPLYNEYEKKNDEIFKSERELNRDIKEKSASMTEAELEQKLDKMMQLQKSKSDLSVEYYAKFKSVIPIKKVAKFYQAEREFRKQLLHEYGKCYGQGGTEPGGPH
ncbi:MAG: hypothetical protein KBB11_04315 [Bacteroidales bacterium]|nr:hypothetical protein [Bacteroidales bacterium]HOY38467.1 hypothetical protein [Bacteroidales bacterium]HQN93574.1 hypothetical protein [Prolixibacteraceae bacterium]